MIDGSISARLEAATSGTSEAERPGATMLIQELSAEQFAELFHPTRARPNYTSARLELLEHTSAQGGPGVVGFCKERADGPFTETIKRKRSEFN